MKVAQVAHCLLLIILLFAITMASHSADYYVSSTGNDSNTGTTPTSAWATIGKVNGRSFLPGDKILFEGGKTFSGTLAFGSDDKGTASSHVTLTSYGTGRAIINGGAGNGITLTSADYFDVTNINVVGLGRKTGNSQGRGVFPKNCINATIDNVETSGFQRAGLELQGCTNLRITNVYAHDNGYAGISSGPESAGVSTGLYIGYSRVINNPGDPTVTNNHSGNGIVLYKVDGAVIEYCEAAENGWDMPWTGNGPVGIWFAYVKNVTVQYCIAHNNKSPGGDGGGFDFDGDSHDCIIQYCYAFENKHYGFQFATWNPACSNLTMRYCISVNNIGEEIDVWGGDKMTNCNIYNNLLFNRDQQVLYGRGVGSEFKFRNNIFLKDGASNSFLQNISNSVVMQGNVYWDLDGGSSSWLGVSTFDDWVAAGHETVGTTVVGKFIDPKLTDPANYPKLTDPTLLTSLSAFKLLDTSPCIDAGLDLNTQFGINPGNKDFYGTSIPARGSFDIGAHESTSNQVSAPYFTPPAAYYTSAQTVTIGTPTVGATIRYTVDGSTPSSSTGIVYTGPITIASNTTLSAIAYKSGMNNSLVSTGAYTIEVGGLTNFFNVSYSGTRNDATQALGYQFTPSQSITVTALGRGVSGSMNNNHAVRLWRVSDQSLLASVTVTPASSLDYLGYKFERLPASVTLDSGVSYRIASDESAGGDAFRDIQNGPISSHASIAAVFSGVWGTAGSYPANGAGGAEGGYVGPTFYTGGSSGNQVSSPTFSPVAGTYTSAQSVTISTATAGASIRYTTDGSTPTSTVGTVYSGAISVGATTTIKAIAYKASSTDSAVATAAYTINLSPAQVATPTFSPAAGTYTSAQSVTISTATAGASIRYTTDGSTPSSTVGTVYSGAISVGATTTIKAIAYKASSTDSAVATASYTISTGTNLVPNFGYEDGVGPWNYFGATRVNSDAHGGAYSAKATGSAVGTWQTITGLQANTTYVLKAWGKLSSTAETAYIYAQNYGGTEQQGAFTTTAYAQASLTFTTGASNTSVEIGMWKSAGAGDAWIDDFELLVNTPPPAQVATPTFSPSAGTYTSAQSVTVSTATAGATIRYTTDGSTPSSTVGTVYSGAINVGATTTIKAIAYKAGSTDSAVATADYTINVPPAGNGTGLRGEYYNNLDFTAFALSRVDTSVNFDWGNGSPDVALSVDTFSVRWTGQIQAKYTETYTFYTKTDDGVRLWVNNQLLVDKWFDQGATEYSGTIALAAGQKYNLRMEYYEQGGSSSAQLLWSSASQAKEVIPQSQLFPAAANSAPQVTSAASALPNPVGLGQTVAFSVAASDPDGDTLSVTWNFGDGTTGSGTSASHAYAAAGFYTATVIVDDGRDGVASSSIQVTVTSGSGGAIPSGGLKVNFQLATSETPAGYLPDIGLPYADRGNGYSYGWNLDNSAQARDRNAPNSPDQRFDTLTHMQKLGNPNAVWEIGIPNGSYSVRAVCGDPSYFDSAFAVEVEGVVVSGTPSATVRWVEGTRTVTVSDGKLTVRNGTGASNNKICFIEISQASALAARSLEDVMAEMLVADPMSITKLRVQMNFGKKGRDTYRVSGELPTLDTTFLPAGAACGVDVGAAIVNFTLDSKGRGKSANGTYRMALKKGLWVYSASLRKGSWTEDWADGGLESMTVNGAPKELPVTLSLNGKAFGGSKALTYTAKENKTGKAK